MDLNKESQLWSSGYKLIAGIDEAGRGPLAGPVVAACVVLKENFSLDSELLKAVKDSKKLKAKTRQELFTKIKQEALAVEIGVVSHQTIDKINILEASFLAMRRALEKINPQPDFILVDGKFKIPKIMTPQEAVIDGDNKLFAIAAASIIAKVSRDYLMEEYDKKYPLYNFKQHKGYGTKHHLEKLKEHGPCPIHRLSFRHVKKED